MYGSRKQCVRLTLHFVDLNCEEDVAEWTERQRDLTHFRVRLPAKNNRFWLIKGFRAFL